MRWVDVCGAPGSGKSTLCDSIWHPHAVEWDGLGLPKEWDAWWLVVDELLRRLEGHPTYHLLLGMTRRSLRKMASVYRRPDPRVYVQTGLAQRGLGFGWRLEELGQVELVREYFRKMPVSLGVAVVSCPIDVAQERNRQRENISRTAHENRAFMVPLMEPAKRILIEEMNARGVPIIEIDTTQPIEQTRAALVGFARERTTDAASPRLGGEVAFVC